MWQLEAASLRGALGGVPLPSDSDSDSDGDSHRSSVFPEESDSTAKPDRIPAEARGSAVTTKPCQAAR